MAKNPNETQLTILFQPSNGVGLGHVNRHIAIAQAVLQKAPSAKLPFLIDGDSHELLHSVSLPYLSLPNQSDLHVFWEAWSKVERDGIVLDLADTVIRRLKPHLIVFDFIPYVAVVQAGISHDVPMAMVVRKPKNVLDYFERIKHIQDYLSLILIPHACNEMEVPKHLAAKTRFVGQIMRQKAEVTKEAHQLRGGKNIVICGGGGGYPNIVEYYNWVLRAFAVVHSHNPEITGILITGPLFQDWWKLKIVDGIQVIPFDSNLMATFESADLVICQAGYNTIAEIRHLAVTTICVPADRNYDDQYERANQTETSSHNFYTCQLLDTEGLIQLINAVLQRPSQGFSINGAGSNGAALAADALIEVAEEYALKRSSQGHLQVTK